MIAKSSAPENRDRQRTVAIALMTRAAVASAPGQGAASRERSTLTDGVPSTVIRVSRGVACRVSRGSQSSTTSSLNDQMSEIARRASPFTMPSAVIRTLIIVPLAPQQDRSSRFPQSRHPTNPEHQFSGQVLVGSERHVGRLELLRNPLEVVDHGLDLLVVTIEEVLQRHADLLFEIRRNRVIGAVSPVRFVGHRISAVERRLEIEPHL
jgi:hypothetical protein